jgi:hypothetical protein
MGDAARVQRIGPQEGPQAALLSCPANEILYGGARGGGKSYGLLLDWVAHAARHGKNARGILFRRTMPELEDMLDKAREVMLPLGWRVTGQKPTWVSPSGATLKMRYLERDAHADRYQGHAYTWLGLDEAGSWPRPDPIDKLRATLRSAAGVKPRMLLSANPGGVGHNWLKGRYIDPVPPYTLQYERTGGSHWSLAYIPARFSDNRVLYRADPGYLDRATDKLPDWLAKAWRDGDWNIIAGGMFDDVWDENHHVVQPFTLPQTWRLDRSFDWGSSRPFSVGWWAESDGSDVVRPDGTTFRTVRGDLFRVAEWYGWNGKPNEGCRMLAKDIARGIKEREVSMGRTFQAGPADSSIFDVENGQCIADDMAQVGIRWTKADKSPGSRRTGAEQLRQSLANAISKDDQPREEPGLFVFDTCRHFIRTVPSLPRSERDPEDIDTEAEDHAYDETRYRVRKVKTAVTAHKLRWN